MSRSALLAGAALALTVAVTAQQGRSGGPPPEPPASTAVKACEQLSSLTFPKLRVTSATSVPAGAATGRRGQPPMQLPASCRVAATATPTSDSDIKIELWIPEGVAWNGRLLGTGNGGFGGAIGYADMTAALAKGFAAVGTDAGHTGDQMDFGLGHPEKIVDWAHRAVHVMTETAKILVRDARGRSPEYWYFDGCSTGGQQGLSEAQRYPDDYDGIVVGDPGHDRTHLIYGFLWSWMALHDEAGKSILPAAKLPAITNAAIAACDAQDGVTDGLISNPHGCTFDPAALLCRGSESDACLTQPQIVAVKKVYAGAVNPRDHEQIFPGWAAGSETGWGTYLLNPKEPARLGLFRTFAFGNPAWDWRRFDWDRDIADVDRRFAYLNATSPNLQDFKTRGGRIVMYTGLADPVVPPADVVAYYDAVSKAMGGLRQTQEFFRFFPVPGMGHCMGGPGPNTFDALGALERWVEHGAAPDSIPASHSANGLVDRARPLCPYPQEAVYSGFGDINDAHNFSCGRP